MQLRRIEIRDFKKLSHVVVDGLTDGLNVLVGDNEAGKSTLLAALRAVLFERHRVGGQAARAMLPHGQEVRPEVTIDFELKGTAWRLRKAFNQRPEAELTGPGERITGDAVEERMAQLLGFQPPGSRGSRPGEHQGVYGLLWVDQGQAHTPLDVGGGQGIIAGALESEVGQVLGGERGRLLLARAETRRNEFWDKRGDKPRGAYRALREEVQALEAQRAELEHRLRRYDEQVAALASRSDALARHARDDRLGKAVLALETARGVVDSTERLAAACKDLDLAESRARLERDTAAERLGARETLDRKAEAGRLGVGIAAAEAEAAQADLARADALAKRAAARLVEARAAREAADRHFDAVDQSIARQTARQARDRAAARLRDAEAIASKQRDAMAAAAAVAVTRKDLADLDRLRADLDSARIKRDAASVQIRFEPTGDSSAKLDGVLQDTGEPLRLSRDAVLELSGFGRLSIRPGGGVEALAGAVEEAEQRLAEKLRKLGFGSRDDAAIALAAKLQAEEEASAQKRLFEVLAPDGLESLRLEVQTLAGSAGPDEGEPAAPTRTEEDRTQARRARQDLQRAEKDAEAEAARLGTERQAASTRAAVLSERALAARRELETALRGLEGARAQVSDALLGSRLAEAERQHGLSASAAATARAALEAADPATAELELRRAEGAERAIRTDIETLTREKRDLEVELRALGQDGVGEQLAETEGRLQRLRQQLGARELEAQASLLLHNTLMQAQTETKDRWLGPVRDRVRPYLKLIQPETEIVLNEKTFSIEHLVRKGVSEPFETLSIGAREQVAVITRLALADILRLSGQPSAIILDDALVNTDEGRLDRMHLVLQKAAESLQVLILTCRERDFYGLGAPIRRL